MTPPGGGLESVRLARRALVVLTLINLFNYLDRWIDAALNESIKHSELRPSDAQLGFLMSGFIVVYMLAAPLFGMLGDTRSRTRLIGLGVGIWSVATALAGFARGFASLFLARATVGVGEAAYGTIAPSLLADYFPRERRGRAFAVFFAAIPIGSALGYVVGGLADHVVGWRGAFFVAGVPGLLLAALTLRLWEPPRGAQDEAAPPRSPGARDALAALLRNRTYALTVIGYAAYTFALGGIAFWIPSFLERVREIPRAQATVQFGAISVVSAALRAPAVALSIFTIHTLGDVRSPALVGMISDARSLGEAVLILPAATLVGGVIWTYAATRPAASRPIG